MTTLIKPKPKRKFESGIQWKFIPIEGKWDTAKYHRWESACRNFYCYRSVGVTDPSDIRFSSVIREIIEDRETQWFVEADPVLKGGYPRYFNSLEEAMESVERYIARQGVPVLTSNRKQVIEYASKIGLEGKPPVEKISRIKKEVPKEKIPEPEGKRIGVIETIVKRLQDASKKHPISRMDIHETLLESFPERDSRGMKCTVDIQVPKRLRLNGWKVMGNDENGFWIEAREK